MSAIPFADLKTLAAHLRQDLATKKFILLYAYNGTGKTRLSTAFKDIGKQAGKPDTLYFNAYTEDLFSWDNDLDGDSERYLVLHPSSNFLAGLEGVDMDTKVYDLLRLYSDFEFDLDLIPLNDENGKFIRNQRIVRFYRAIQTASGSSRVENIKVSRSEENLFIWCFYLAVLQMVLDGDEAYDWVKYIYIDDPISSLDENNAIAVATHLAQMLINATKKPGTVISTHHVLCFNVLFNELKGKARKQMLTNDRASTAFLLSDSTDKPFLHHLATLAELNAAQTSGSIKRHHFNMMRCIMEQTAIFCGLDDWKQCLKKGEKDSDKALHERMINVMSHADYLINEPDELNAKYKDDFRKIFLQFVANHPFNPALFPSAPPPAPPPEPAPAQTS
jgi:hypothetical protein